MFHISYTTWRWWCQSFAPRGFVGYDLPTMVGERDLDSGQDGRMHAARSNYPRRSSQNAGVWTLWRFGPTRSRKAGVRSVRPGGGMQMQRRNCAQIGSATVRERGCQDVYKTVCGCTI